ncbi:MAG: hypothetical protein V2A34_11045 [Lentisphaerota bacterium]
MNGMACRIHVVMFLMNVVFSMCVLGEEFASTELPSPPPSDAAPVTQPVGEMTALPCRLYVDYDAEGEMVFIPSGWMGATEAIEMDDAWAENVQSGTSCIKASFSDPKGWGGVVWQNPANNWGEDEGGIDLSSAQQLSFWARGEKGGEIVEFKMGLVAMNKPYYDTGKASLGRVKLTSTWKQYIIPLAGKNLKRIVTGFSWITAGKSEPVVFYLDNIAYE